MSPFLFLSIQTSVNYIIILTCTEQGGAQEGRRLLDAKLNK